MKFFALFYSSFFTFEIDAVSKLRYKTNAEQRLTKCINIKGSLLKCVCGSPEAAFKKCFVKNDSIEDTPLGDKPNRCLGSNFHCSLCRKVINWMALRSECSGLAANTASCKEKAEKARRCPDLTENFDYCWSHMQTCTETQTVQLKSSRTNLLPSSKFSQNIFKKCILNNPSCFEPLNISKNQLRDDQEDKNWLSLISKFEISDLNKWYFDEDLQLLDNIELKLRDEKILTKQLKKTKKGSKILHRGIPNFVPNAESMKDGFSFPDMDFIYENATFIFQK